jgi:hypothetical protein
MDSVWFEVLVIILGSFLALFLILAILLTVKLIQIVKVVKRITEQAEQMADRAEHITAFFEKTATPVALLKLIANFSDVLGRKGRRKK